MPAKGLIGRVTDQCMARLIAYAQNNRNRDRLSEELTISYRDVDSPHAVCEIICRVGTRVAFYSRSIPIPSSPGTYTTMAFFFPDHQLSIMTIKKGKPLTVEHRLVRRPQNNTGTFSIELTDNRRLM